MAEHILFLTGKLAEKQLHAILEKLQPEFNYTIHQLGLKVAALMTTDMIARRLTNTFGADKIIIPGRCRGDIDSLSEILGIRVERGPEELKDLPNYFGEESHNYDLDKYDIKIFAEIVEAPHISVDQIIDRAIYYRNNGADVIDIGCLPNTDFPHLAAAIRALKSKGFIVSVDSLNDQELLSGGQAGADYLLSLHEKNLWIAGNVAAMPVLIPEKHEDLESLERAILGMESLGRSFIVDPILDPIQFGFTNSLIRYVEIKKRFPKAEIMMGIGNITELTHVDTSGMNTLLIGICSELGINNILTTEVSGHARRAVKEADLARRIMFAAKENQILPKHIHAGLMALHEPSPFPYDLPEIKELSTQITDPSFRIQNSAEGIHIFNRDGLYSSEDPFDLYPHLNVENDSAHAFYLGVELARAQIAWQLGKRYNQDQPLSWGCASEIIAEESDPHSYKPAGTTLQKKK